MGSFDIAEKKMVFVLFQVSGVKDAANSSQYRRLFGFYRELKKTLKRVCQTPELTGDQLFFKNQIYPSINEGLNEFNKKICYYLISEPIRNKINEIYFNKNTEKSKTARFLSDRQVGIPIGIVDFRSELWGKFTIPINNFSFFNI